MYNIKQLRNVLYYRHTYNIVLVSTHAGDT